MAKFCKLKSSTLTDYYKNHLSGYLKWEQSEHADEYLCFPANLGEHLSIDETSLSNGELYTIVTNKAGHGRKGTLVAMAKGTDSKEVCRRLFHKLPAGKRRKVKTITLDMSASMSLIAKKCFPLAKQIIDRFHVQKEFKEALQDLRIQYRWQAMEESPSVKRKIQNTRLRFLPMEIHASSYWQEAVICCLKIRMSGLLHKSKGQKYSLRNMMTSNNSTIFPCV